MILGVLQSISFQIVIHSDIWHYQSDIYNKCCQNNISCSQKNAPCIVPWHLQASRPFWWYTIWCPEFWIKGFSPVTRNLCCQSARGNRSGAVRYFPEAVGPRGNTAAPDRFPRPDWQHNFLVTGLNPDYNMVTVPVQHRKVPNRRFQQDGRHFVLQRFWRLPLSPPPTSKS